MTFLELCQLVAEESGMVDGTNPTTVTGQVGILAKIVRITAEVWRKIQLARPNWKWMRAEFTSSALAAVAPPIVAKYTAVALMGATLALRWGRWFEDDVLGGYYPMSIYDSSIGVSDESKLTQMSWTAFRDKYMRGSQTAGRPIEWAISPAGELCLGPNPSISTYIVKGEYWKSPQLLVEDGDEPEVDAQYHTGIAYTAVTKLNSGDEASPQAIKDARDEANKWLDDLERDQLPNFTFGGGPIA